MQVEESAFADAIDDTQPTAMVQEFLQLTERVPQRETITKFTRMLVYRYISLKELIQTISRISRKERKMLQNSHIINENRNWTCKFWTRPSYKQRKISLLKGTRMKAALKKISFILSLTERVTINIQPTRMPLQIS